MLVLVCISVSFCTLSLEVMKRSHDARMRLLRLGIFKEVEVLIDVSEGT